MRAVSAKLEKLLTNPRGRTTHLRVKVEDSLGVLRDLTTLVPGANMVVAADWGEDVDSNGYTAEIQVRREKGKFSVSPFLESSALNRGFDPTAQYAPLIDPMRMVVIETAVTGNRKKPTAGDWVEAFRGYTTGFDLANTPLTLSCRDQSALLVDTTIEEELVYGYAQDDTETPTRGCRIWTRNTLYELGQLVIPTEAKLNGHFYRVINAGLSDDVEPAPWPTTVGATVVNGGVEFENVGTTSAEAGWPLEAILQQLMVDWLGDEAPILYVPVSPGRMIRWFNQSRGSLWAGMRALVDQIGWDLRYKWDDVTSSFRLTLWCPDREKTTPDRQLGQYDGPALTGIKRLAVDVEGIRNYVRGVISDVEDLSPTGTPRRKVVDVDDPASIERFKKKRFMEVAEDSLSNINTIAEITVLVTSILSDLSLPVADFSVALPYLPGAELGDLYRYPPNRLYWSVERDFANTSVRHSVSAGLASTTLGGRGKPSAGYKRWLRKDTRALGPASVHALNTVTADELPVVSIPIVGGNRIKTNIANVPHRPNMRFEHHLSEDPDFEPDSTTLQVFTEQRDVVIPDQVPGAELYHRVVPVWFNAGRVVRGEPSAPLQLEPGRASGGHLQQDQEWGRQPLNGGFETWLETSELPDHWEETGDGAWGSDFIRATGPDGVSGAQWLRFLLGVGDTSLRTRDVFSIEALSEYEFSWNVRWTDAGVAGGALHAQVLFYESDGTLITGVQVDQFETTTGDIDVWYRRSASVTPPADARFARIQIEGAGADAVMEVDAVRWVMVGDQWHVVENTDEPAFENDWENNVDEEPLAFRRAVDGEIQLQGFPKSTSALADDGDESNDDNTVFTLPSLYRPERKRRFAVYSATGVPGRVCVLPTGEVRVVNGHEDGISFDQVRFRILNPTSTPDPPDLLSGIIAYWALDGDSTDAIGSADGTDSGITYGSGKISSALIGSGSTKVTFPTSGLTPSTVSVAAWVKHSTGPGQAYICCVDNAEYPTTYGGFTLLTQPTTHYPSFVIGKNLGTGYTPGTDFESATGTTAIGTGAWQHIVGTYDGANIKVYVNGVLETTQAWGTGLFYGGTVYGRIGCERVTIFGTPTDPYFPWPGSLDEVGIWNRALTAGEVTELYNAGAGRTYPF